MLFYIILQPPCITNTASNCYVSGALQCLMNHSIFVEFLQLTSKPACCECTKSGIIFEVKKFKLIQTYAVTQKYVTEGITKLI